MPERRVVDFWFDPVCPYTWITSRWLLEVTEVRPVDIRWRLMSLSVLNEHLEVNPEGDWGEYMWAPVRVCAAVEERFGQRALGALFTTLGTRFHLLSDWDFAAALTDAGLPGDLVEAAGSTAYDTAIRASHAEAVALAGDDIGTPVMALETPPGEPRTGFFGPVVSPAPTGETAGRLWDGVLHLMAVPGFYEIKRPRTEEPRFDMARAST
ncbi:disulfide bond formation protein DsbA [Streptomyces sp. NPDC048290]|uniref:mycothiol-dependent nitroreductase Rv2466c family protein n=1 Tax=Streptomyces sp. NPDC048290 TaxID=3155811 RepID=UPI00343EBEC6